jgi:D-glycero-D-manno-heptose 1,7-bisphosphate phosphatase
MKPAVFLDRDGTLIKEVDYLVDPADVQLLPGAGKAVARLREAGFAVVVITNQSAIGRGMLTEAGLNRIHAELACQLDLLDTALDGIYHCPVAPTTTTREAIEHPNRKPGPGMLLKAAADLRLDLAHSWMVGDMLSDLLAGRNAGVHATVLVRTGHGPTVDETHPAIDHVADDLAAAVDLILLP